MMLRFSGALLTPSHHVSASLLIGRSAEIFSQNHANQGLISEFPAFGDIVFS